VNRFATMMKQLHKKRGIEQMLYLSDYMRKSQGIYNDPNILEIMMNGFLKANSPSLASKIYKKMKKDGMHPDQLSPLVIKSMAQSGNLELMWDFMEDLKKNGIKMDIALFNVLFDGIKFRST
jgi:pentatricopeptide repeat protein